MRYLIDGNNLIGHSPDLSLDHPDCRGHALGKVAEFCRTSGARATIWFDGGPDRRVGERGVSLGPVRGLLAGKGVEADTRIIDEIERRKGGQAFTVVSSDRRIYGTARSAGLPALRIHEFNALLGAGRARQVEAEEQRAEMAAKRRVPSSEEVDRWLEIFGEDS
jgi:hypothetical protein